MSQLSQEAAQTGAPDDTPVRPIFKYEVHREGRTIATLRAHRTETGAITVDSEVFPLTQALGSEGIKRPFTFSSLDHARRFADEALVVFEYLNCTIL